MFNAGMAAPSLADIAAVTRNNGNDGGFGDGNGWWVLIILFAIFGGWGNGGYGMNAGGYGSGTQFVEAAVQRGFDTQTVINKLDGINSGICSLGYDQLAQMNGINNNIMQASFGLQNSINQVDVNAMQNANAISAQLAACCCENRQGQADIKYAMASDTCAITTAINQAAQNIMQNDNANYRQLHDENIALQMAQKNEQIQNQAARIAQLELQASQAQQNNYLVDTLRPCPQPAYITCNPFTGTINPYGNNGSCGYNNNNGCGC